MKNMIIIGTMMLISLSGCDDVINAVDNGVVELQKATEKGWGYSTKVDKLTQAHSASAIREFTDKDVDFVRVDVELICKNGKELTGKITTYDTRSDKDGNMEGVRMSYNSDKINFIKTRSGKNPINYLISLPKYNNEMLFNVAHPDDGAGDLLYQLSLFGINIPEESASLMVSNEWIVRIETTLGNPTITVDFNDPIVKKVTSQCKWKPAFAKVPQSMP